MQAAEEEGRLPTCTLARGQKLTSKQCNEGRPSCSRCVKQSFQCQYPATADDAEEGASAAGRDPVADRAWSTRLAAGNNGGVKPLPHLSSRELDLLSHYIAHTSRVIPSDKEDVFVLHVGIPNLAFTSAAVMGSLLALAATCKCHDMLDKSPSPSSLQNLDEMRQLLVMADGHHQASLNQLQQAICERQFDPVLANAALMVLYALSGQCVRVLLSGRAKRANLALPDDMLPLHSQWITSIRAAYVAFLGLMEPGVQHGEATPKRLVSQDVGRLHALPSGLLDIEATLPSPEDGPSEETERLLLPIVSASYAAALTKLRSRSEHIYANAAHDSKLDACLEALGLLEELYHTVLGDKQQDAESPAHDLGALHDASPWLTRYLARVTSASPSKLWRRTVMAFLSRVPMEFLQVVQSVLDCTPTDESQSNHVHLQEAVELSAAHKPAMDIFAHWLILVMLLDGVWWIGGIGRWELGRILAFTEPHGWLSELAAGETWWPKTIYSIETAS